MSESSRVALASPTVVDDVEQRPVRSGRRRGSIFATGVTALATVVSCGTDSGEGTAQTTEPNPPVTTTERPFCTDSGELPKPVIEGNKTFLTVLSYCVGNPKEPVGFYKPSDSPKQIKENAFGVVDNERLVEPQCQIKGEYIRTDAAADANANGKTGTDIWVRGIVVGNESWGPADVPATNLGLPGDALQKVYDEQNLPQLPPCPPM